MKRFSPVTGLVLILLVSILLAAFKITDGHNWGDDFALYLSQTKALLNGHVLELYQQNKFAMDHSSHTVGPYLYPFGFPVLLSPVYALFGMNFIALKIYCTLFFLLSLVVTYYLFRSYFAQASQALLVVAAMAFHPEFIGLTDNVLSDFPFLFFSLLSLWIMQKPHSLLQQVTLGLCISFSYFVRDIGIALLPALLVYQLASLFQEKKTRSSITLYLIPYVVFACAYLTIANLFPKGGANHYDMFWANFTPAGLAARLVYYWNLLSIYFFVGPLLLFGVFLTVLSGMIATWRKNIHFIVYTSAVLAILVIWPATQGARFIFPVIPFLVYFMIQGLLVAYYKLYVPHQHLRLVKVSVFALVVVVCAVAALGAYGFIQKRNNRTAQAIADNQCYTEEMKGLYAYITVHVPKQAIISFSKPRALRWFTDRNGIFREGDAFNTGVADYVLLHKKKLQGLAVPSDWQLIHQTTSYSLFKKRSKA